MILIALGANLPFEGQTPAQTLARCIPALSRAGVHVTARSRLWATAPVPYDPVQPDYMNAVVAVETALDPAALMNTLLSVERKFGRVRTVANAARTLDLDILAFHDVVLNENDLILPHPRLEGRAFVLKPLMDIAADWKHPVTGRTAAAMMAVLPDTGEARPAKAWPDDNNL